MFNEIKANIEERIAAQPDSRCASADEVRMCWLICQVESLQEKVEAAENCLVCAAIADPFEVCENTLAILNPERYPAALERILTKTPDFHPGLESYDPKRYRKGGGVCALEDASDIHTKCGKALRRIVKHDL